MEPRRAVLLGAGASADAGLPLTFQLAERVVQRANEQPDGPGRRDWVSVLNFVYGSMVGYQAEDGGDPLGAVNIEKLISALRLLQNLADHEAAPFVSAWKPAALGVGVSDADESAGSRLVRGIERTVAGDRFLAKSEIVGAVAQISRLAARGGNPAAFAEAEGEVLTLLVTLLSDLQDVDYLKPLADLARRQEGGLDVLTLNYDLSVETMTRASGVRVDRLVDRWRPGEPLELPEVSGRMNLLKLHGSLDWFAEPPPRLTSVPGISVEPPPDAKFQGQRRRARPWIVVGDREKLATDGPTLALLQAAESALRKATHLVVVGYSFADSHINALIRNWLLGDGERTITVVDKNWSGKEGFPAALVAEYGARPSRGQQSRLLPLEGTARERLAESFTASPAITPEIYGEATSKKDGELFVIRVRNLGPDLRKASFYLNNPRGPEGHYGSGTSTYTTIRELRSDRPLPHGSWRTASVERFAQGDEIELYTDGPIESGAAVDLFGFRRDSAEPVHQNLPLVPSDV